MLCISLGAVSLLCGQTSVEYNFKNLEGFKSPAANWKIVSDVWIELGTENPPKTTSGSGILYNDFSIKKREADLLTDKEFSNVDFEVEFMMLPNSNSGIYFMDRYEIQLFDSWGVIHPKFSDCGGIYQMWDAKKGKGNEGYLGIAPNQNACFAPGIWQKLSVEFQAPKFNDKGDKVSNAKFLKVKLNGILIHENVECLGATRGGNMEPEVDKAPIRIQGDHGRVAFRNMKLQTRDDAPVKLTNLQYQLYGGAYRFIPSFKSIKPLKVGSSKEFTVKVATSQGDDFALIYSGMMEASTAGLHSIILKAGGKRRLLINDLIIIDSSKKEKGWEPDTAVVMLKKGANPFTFEMARTNQQVTPTIALIMKGPGFRWTDLHDITGFHNWQAREPFPVEAEGELKIFRGFMKQDRKVLPYSIAAAWPSGNNLAWDQNSGGLFKLWKMRFLDVTGMWHSRGDDQIMWTRGAEVPLKNGPTLAMGSQDLKNWPDSLDSKLSYRFIAYSKKKNDTLCFEYQYGNSIIEDRWQSSNPTWYTIPNGSSAALEKILNGAGTLKRVLNIKGDIAKDGWIRLGTSSQIFDRGKNWFQCNGYWLYVPNGNVKIEKDASSDFYGAFVPVKINSGNASVQVYYVY